MELPDFVGGLSREGASDTESQHGDTVDVGHHSFLGRWKVYYLDAAISGVLQIAQHIARRSAAAALAGQHRDLEGSNAQPGGRTFHRMHTRLLATTPRRTIDRQTDHHASPE